ncbi:oligopeptide ABC transporter permease OppB [Cobetia marina]|jgi:oligopeptide transport system permease protein|uniref:Oligopeptide ABC transporter permease OppB n=2 Tax=Cobetia TaxID=204286 RepID=A0ABT6UQQ4_9GAMM|nr:MULTISPECIES: oligopeptide ABC transporter permease OppB [Cobetia]MBR9755450.1 oligopeptide ABC transporter permease OppB [Gammaproteobacteria bacterium]TCJ27301.1 oligopeptide ABC transporter permease OppB [Halomonas sp. GDM18]KGA00840.1 oligopeptide transporter permease [Cobetia amphilecti]KPM77714.1 oligopeptide transporter permease [Cobetia sp. UCD-24C]MBE2169787.1 oligopeptide ABC transporter permease OppB [Cobetia sp. 2AS1]|tara:strand:- start:9887 stop:10813 length:927 start_codon:yes stop_codon:yes gene_type:complete
MLSYTLKRLLQAIPTLLIVITLSFFLMRVAPGGPFDGERRLPPEIEQNLRAAYHLDEPLPMQYLRYLGDLVQGDLGPSFKYKDFDVSELISQGFPASLELGMWAILAALLIGVPLGVIAAIRRNSTADYVVMSTALAGIAVPNFVIAPLLALVFGVLLGWLPAGGWNGGAWQNLLLPVVALSIQQIAYIARMMRASMIEVLGSHYIRTARAKGLSEWKVILRHALRPAMLPVVSYLGPAIAGIITGSVVIEQIFGIPGIGRYFVQGALNRDYTLVMGTVVFYGALILLLNLIVDLLYSMLDPQIRYDD